MSKRKKEIDERIELLEIRFYSSERLDKQMVFINSGALVLSMGFIENIVDIGESYSIWMLICSWGLFTGSLVVNLLSHSKSIKAVDARIIGDDDKSDKIDSQTQYLNYISLGALLVGLIFLIIYVTINTV